MDLLDREEVDGLAGSVTLRLQGTEFVEGKRPLPVANPVLPPRCAARFTIVRSIGTGGFGSVWLARDREQARLVALKLLHAACTSGEAAYARFLDEARVTALLDHPHIVRLLDHDVEDGRPWIVYEYLGDTSLQTLLNQRGCLTLSGALEVGVQLADALAAAHAQGIVHRDLKPDNVIAVSAGHYKLIDFGVASGAPLRGRVTGLNQIMGTPNYLAPEQLRCQPASPASDQYQLGLLLFQLVSGTIPHRDDNLQQMLIRRMSVDPVPLAEVAPGVPGEVCRVVARMLARRPEERFETLEQAREAIECAATSISMGTGQRVHAPTRRTRAPIERQRTPHSSRVRRSKVVPILSAPTLRASRGRWTRAARVAVAALALGLAALCAVTACKAGVPLMLRAVLSGRAPR